MNQPAPVAGARSDRERALALAPALRPVGRFRTARSMLSLFVGVTTLAIVLQTWWTVDQDKRQTLESERENGLVAVRLLEEHANQQLEAAALRLEVIANGSAAISQDAPLEDAQVRNLIEDSLKNSRSAGALQFVNLRGLRWASMIDFPAFVFNAEPREYIGQLLKDPGNKGTVVGHPFQRYIDGEAVLPLARNLYDHRGRHVGVLSTEVSVTYFNTVYERAAHSSKAIVQMIAAAGFVIVRSPFDAHSVNLDISRAPLLARVNQGPPEGALEHLAMPGDTKARLYTYRKVQNFPVIILFGRDVDTVLANWSGRTWDRITFSGVFVALHLLLTYYLLLHMKRLQHSEAKLRESEAKFVDLFQRAPIPLALIRIDNDELIEANDAILMQFGYARADFIGKTPHDLQLWVNPELRRSFKDSLIRQQAVERYEVQLRHSDGTIFTCLLSSRLIDAGGQRVGIFSPNDVSRQRAVEHEIRELNAELEQRVLQRTINLEEALTTVKNMQSELVRSEKMAALGSLVAGIAHELNTPIGNSVTVASTISAHATSVTEELASARPRRSVLEQLAAAIVTGSDIVVRNLQRAATLVTSFKQVAVDQSSDLRRSFDVAQAIEEVVLTLEASYKGICTVETTLARGLVIDSFPGALIQVVTNLINNALIHAFDGKTPGTVHIATRAIDGANIEITVSDNGCGIDPEHLGRVFDPFFTTKLGQGGSGLGMNIVYNLVTGTLGGGISLHSEMGQGAVITITLPVVAPA